MDVTFELDTNEFQTFTTRMQKHLLYSAQQGLNDTIKDVQKAEQDHLAQVFTIRKEAFMRRLIKATFANITRGTDLQGWVYIDPNKNRILLALFEEGGVRPSFTGREMVAVPLTGEAARPDIEASVTPSLRFTALRFKKTKLLSRKGKGPIWKGLLGTYIVPDVGVFQRTPGTQSVEIYAFKRSVRLPKSLDFYGVGTATAADRWIRNFSYRYLKAKI